MITQMRQTNLELWDDLHKLNEAGETPSIAGADSEGKAFLAYLTEVGGDETMPGVLFDEPHEPSYGMNSDRVCDECGCPHRRWSLGDLAYPVMVRVKS